MHEDLIIGIDGGGTFTRVLVVNRRGRVIASGQGGAALIDKDPDAAKNVRNAIVQTVSDAGRRLEQVVALTAGIAGYDTPEDLKWVKTLTELEELRCSPVHVNDAVVAHRGAFVMGPGIIVVAGTGSMILAITETGRQARNFDFGHYASTAARHLSGSALHQVLAARATEADAQLVRRILQHFGAQTTAVLREQGAGGFGGDRIRRNRLLAELAPHITACAEDGSPLAQSICDRAIDEIAVGVRILGPLFEQRPVPVALIGGVATSSYFSSLLPRILTADGEYRVEPRHFSAAAGAVLMALTELGVPLGREVLAELRAHPAARAQS